MVAPEPAVVTGKGCDEFATFPRNTTSLGVGDVLVPAITMRVMIEHRAIRGPFKLGNSTFIHHELHFDALARSESIARLIPPDGRGIGCVRSGSGRGFLDHCSCLSDRGSIGLDERDSRCGNFHELSFDRLKLSAHRVSTFTMEHRSWRKVSISRRLARKKLL